MSNNLSHVKVEIILPNYNSEVYLEETIESVINQTFKDWRLTIVDGNSNSATQGILEKYISHSECFSYCVLELQTGRPAT